MLKKTLLIPICIVMALVCSNPAAAAGRTALVIGNAAYLSSPLANPGNDAADMARVLKRLGFDVILKVNADKKTMKQALRDFKLKLGRSEIGLFYYAGHGMQIDGVNYLIPVNTSIREEWEVESEAIGASRFLAAMKAAGTPLNIVILDACRDNPFKRSFRTSEKGLAQMSAPAGTIISYATAAGSVAEDGRGRNGTYTEALLKSMNRTGLNVRDMFNDAGLQVMKKTGNTQVPWVSTTPIPDYYLKGKGTGAVTQPPARPVSPSPDKNTEIVFWESIKESNNPRLFEAYLKKFPDGLFRDIALIKLEDASGRSASGTSNKVAMGESPSIPDSSPGRSFTESETGMEFVWIPAGCFQMGSNSWEEDERPIHEVCVDGFWMAKTEVTIGQYRKYLMATGNTQGVDFSDKDCPIRQGGSYALSRNAFGQSDDQPMVELSWHAAKGFVDWLSQKTGRRFGLPTEAQWEYAARGGVPGQLYAGSSNLGSVAWYTSNSGNRSHEVGLKPPNGFGLYDMTGNVWEWCQDVYDATAYTRHSRNNPVVASYGTDRLNRGGSWNSPPKWSRSANRLRRASDGTYSVLGFRVCMVKGKR